MGFVNSLGYRIQEFLPGFQSNRAGRQFRFFGSQSSSSM
jgi:hypothetical protein